MSYATGLALFVFLMRMVQVWNAGDGWGNGQSDRRSGTGWAGMVWILCGIFTIFAIAILRSVFERGETVPMVLAVVVFGPLLIGQTVLIAPSLFARLLAIPWGKYRAAYWLGRVSFWVLRKDPPGGALAMSARAIVQARTHELATPEHIREARAWLDDRLRTALEGSTDLRGGTVVAAGLLHLAEGNEAQARSLFRSLFLLPAQVTPDWGRALALEWLMADALSRGAWNELEDMGRWGGRLDAQARLIVGCASRITEPEAGPSPLSLRASWMLAPKRRVLTPLLRRALEMGIGSPTRRPGPRPVEIPDHVAPRERALLLHTLMLGRPRGEAAPQELRSVCASWDEAMSADRLAVEPLRRDIEGDLSRFVLDHELPVGGARDPGPTLDAVTTRVELELMAELEYACTQVADRMEFGRDLDALDEWRGFVAIVEKQRRIVTILGHRGRLHAQALMDDALSALTYRLYNDRDLRAMSVAISQFLLTEAIAAGDGDAIELHQHNSTCDL